MTATGREPTISTLGTRSRKPRIFGGIAAAVAIASLVVPLDGAGAVTQIGQTFQGATGNCSPGTRLQSGSPSGQYAAPSPGVITSWSIQSGSGSAPVKFKVARNAGGDNFAIVAESEFQSIDTANVLNTFPIRIPVLAGDVIGHYAGTPSVFGCTRSAPGFTVHQSAFDANPAPGTTSAFTPSPALQLSLSAVLEPDCDSDGFGDETQDPDTKVCKDSEFSFGKLKRNKKRGTAKLTVTAPGPGTLTLAGKGLVKQRPGALHRNGWALTKTVAGAGAVKLKIKPKGRRKAKLAKTGKLKVKAKLTYTPTGGLPNTKTKRIRLVERR